MAGLTLLTRSPVEEPRSTILNHEVMAGCGDQNEPRLQQVAVARLRGGQGSSVSKDVRQDAREVGREVEHDDHRGRQVRGQLCDETGQRLDTPC